MDNKYCVIVTTCENENKTKKIIDKLLNNKLATCIQTTQVTSHYSWKGKVEHQPEIMLLIKTRVSLYQEIEELIKKNHNYDTPEIIQLPIQNGSKDYFDWIEEVTQGR